MTIKRPVSQTRPRSAAMALLAAVVLGSWVVDAVPVLLPNADMEQTDGGSAAFWEARTPTDGLREMTRDTLVFHSPAAALAIHNRARTKSRWRTGHLRDVRLKPGSTAVLSAWIRTALEEGSAFLTLYSIDSQGDIAAQAQSERVRGTTEWTRIRHQVTIPAATAYVMPYLELEGVGSAWFDDVALTGVSDPDPPAVDMPTTSIAPADFIDLSGFSRYRRAGSPVIGLGPDQPAGQAQAIFWGPTARYDLLVRYMDERDGASSLTVSLNGRDVKTITFDRTPTDHPQEQEVRTARIENVDIQQRSRIGIAGRAHEGEYCRVLGITAGMVGTFAGSLAPPDALRLPPSLVVFENPAERRTLHGQHARVGNAAAREAAERRRDALAACKRPQDWRAYQQRVRDALPEILGDFSPKCPLNPRVTGRIVRDDYVIENIVFESHSNYYVTANLYLPADIKGQAPAVLFTCGHAAEGKAYHLYHECCLGFVLKGYVVLALDPTGQGERSEYVDPASGDDLVPRCVPQHHVAGRPSWLVGRSLAGYRVWDCVRAVDLLLARPEVDPERVAAVGNSGGGQMALLITAADERISACAAAHPGGSMENTYLTGRGVVDKDLLGLIAPRPCSFIVGRDSGESWHATRCEDTRQFYEGLGVATDRIQHALVDGVHDMKQPKREAAYAWVNRWLGMEEAGAEEPPLSPETVEALHCTPTGAVQTSLGGETIASLNLKRALQIRPKPPVATPENAKTLQRDLQQRTRATFGHADVPDADGQQPATIVDEFEHDGLTIRKLILASVPAVQLPAVLIQQAAPPQHDARPVPGIVLVSQHGKPRKLDVPSLPLALARQGLAVLAVDVRGTGECDPRHDVALRDLRYYDSTRFAYESAAVSYAHTDSTLCAWQSLDIRRAVAALRHLLSGAHLTSVTVVAEGAAGVWGLVAAAETADIDRVICVDLIPSYLDLLAPGLYQATDYQWVPKAVSRVDISELPGLCAPRPVALLNPAAADLSAMPETEARQRLAWASSLYDALGKPRALTVQAGLDTATDLARAVATRVTP